MDILKVYKPKSTRSNGHWKYKNQNGRFQSTKIKMNQSQNYQDQNSIKTKKNKNKPSKCFLDKIRKKTFKWQALHKKILNKNLNF